MEWRTANDAESIVILEFVDIIACKSDSFGVCEEVIEDIPSVNVAVPVRKASSEAHSSISVPNELNWVVFTALEPEVGVPDLNIEAWELGIIEPLLNFGEGELVSESSLSEPGAK